MKISLTYETTITATVDLDTSTVESITVLKVLGTSPSGLDGYIHVEGIRPDQTEPYSPPSEPFRREQVRRAVEILKSSPHPEWVLKEPTK